PAWRVDRRLRGLWRAPVRSGMIPARWAVAAPPDPQLTAALASDLHIPEPLAALLVQRGLAAPELAKAFLRPDLERLSDPHAWADMPRAVELVVAAVRAGAPILVHGDYDVDGQCAAALLTRVLSSVGGRVHAFVPHRLRDGYDFAPAGRRADHHLRLWYHRGGGGTRRPGGRHRGHRHRPPSPRRRAPPGVRGARSAARRLPLRSEGAVRHGRRIQARAGARAGAGVVASSAAS